LVGALIITFIPSHAFSAIRSIALAATSVSFFLSIFLLVGFDPAEPGFQLGTSKSWIPEWGVTYKTGLDGISLWMVMLTTFLMPLAVLASASITSRVKPYFIFLLALETALLGVFCALDMFLFYLFWEASLVPMYFIIGMWGYGRRVYAAMKFFLFTLVGSLLMLAGILYLYFTADQPTFDYEALLGTPLALEVQRLLFLAFFASFAVKVPLVPLHTWLPDAHTEAPTAGSVILAAVLLKLGAYGFIRFGIALFPDAARELAPLLMTLAVIGIIYGALIAIVQKDLKRLVAYSSVAHLGFVMLGLFVGSAQAMSGGVLQMVNHGLSTGALFLLVGALYERRHTRLIADFGGLAKSAPVMAGIFLLVALSSLGLPALNGFVGEFLVLLGTFYEYRYWVVPAAFGIVLAAIYLLWAYQRVFHGEPSGANRTLPDMSGRELAMLLPLVAAIVFIGVYPKPLLDRINPAAERAVIQLKECTVDPELVAARPAAPTDCLGPSDSTGAVSEAP
jgi:NADH-quinone oxidoreductase subunit M